MNTAHKFLLPLFFLHVAFCSVISYWLVYASRPGELGQAENIEFVIPVILLSMLSVAAGYFSAPRQLISAIVSFLNLNASRIERMPAFYLAVTSFYYVNVACVQAILFYLLRNYDINSLKAAGGIGLGVFTFWLGTPLMLGSLLISSRILAKSHGKASDILALVFVITPPIISCSIIGYRSLIISFLVAFFLLNYEKIKAALALFRSTLRLKALLLLIFFFVFLSVVSILKVTFARNSDFDLSWFLRVDGLKALEVVTESRYFTQFSLDRAFSIVFEPLTIAFPRLVFEWKPVPVTVQMTQDLYLYIYQNRGFELFGNEGGVSATYIGEFLWAFSVWLIVPASYLIGLYCKVLSSLLNQSFSLLASVVCSLLAALFVMSAESFTVYANTSVFVLFQLVLYFGLSCIFSVFGVRSSKGLS